MNIRRMQGIIAFTAAISLAACERDPQAPGADADGALFSRVNAGELDGLAKQVKQATMRFHSTTLAEMAGYHEEHTCVAVPALGGMGYHWPNFGLVDPVFDPLRPEVLLYASKPNGHLELVAIEYVVLDVGQPAPTFDGVPFMEGGTPVPVAHWSLHVWLHRENPNGMFTPFNPAVTCP